MKESLEVCMPKWSLSREKKGVSLVEAFKVFGLKGRRQEPREDRRAWGVVVPPSLQAAGVREGDYVKRKIGAHWRKKAGERDSLPCRGSL